MPEYTLRMRARRVSTIIDPAHTSYDLVIKNDDGSVEIRTVERFVQPIKKDGTSVFDELGGADDEVKTIFSAFTRNNCCMLQSSVV